MESRDEMNPIYINGIGVVTPKADELEGIWNLIEGEEAVSEIKIHEIPPFISSRKTRRMDRFSILALYGAYSVFKDLSKFTSELEPYEVGTVYHSDFGSLNTLLEFVESLSENNEIEPSPVTFTNTVLNACIGHLCIELGLKGDSTMLMGSNYVGYAMQLIRHGKVKSALIGGLEEHNVELFDAFNGRGICVSEGVSTMLLSGEKTVDSFCEIITYFEMNLKEHYCFDKQFKPKSDDIKKAINHVLVKASLNANQIDAIITASNNQDFTDAEVIVAHDVFGKKIDLVHPKYLLGELLGASLGINLTIGALILKKQRVPLCLTPKKEVNYVLVSDFNIYGNYTVFILKR